MSATSTTQIGIVLTDDQPSEGLLRAVDGRHWTARVVTSPIRAMAELCIATRAQRQRAAWGLRIEPPVLVHDDSASSAGREELLAAIVRYLPEVAVWRYDGNQVQLQQASSEPVKRSHRMVRAHTAARLPVEPASITRQELDMLLEMDNNSGDREP